MYNDDRLSNYDRLYNNAKEIKERCLKHISRWSSCCDGYCEFHNSKGKCLVGYPYNWGLRLY